MQVQNGNSKYKGAGKIGKMGGEVPPYRCLA